MDLHARMDEIRSSQNPIPLLVERTGQVPYVSSADRAFIEKYGPLTIGQLTYVLMREVLTWLDRQAVVKYREYAEVLGALRSVELELYLDRIAPYEYQKKVENGEVETKVSVEVGEGLGSRDGGTGGVGGSGNVYREPEANSFEPYVAAGCQPRYDVAGPGPRVRSSADGEGRPHKKKRIPRKAVAKKSRKRPARSNRRVR